MTLSGLANLATNIDKESDGRRQAAVARWPERPLDLRIRVVALRAEMRPVSLLTQAGRQASDAACLPPHKAARPFGKPFKAPPSTTNPLESSPGLYQRSSGLREVKALSPKCPTRTGEAKNPPITNATRERSDRTTRKRAKRATEPKASAAPRTKSAASASEPRLSFAQSLALPLLWVAWYKAAQEYVLWGVGPVVGCVGVCWMASALLRCPT